MEMKTALLRIPAFIIDLVLAMPLGFFCVLVGRSASGEKAIWLEGDRCEDRPASIRVSMVPPLLAVLVGGIPECLPLYSGACFPGAKRVS